MPQEPTKVTFITALYTHTLKDKLPETHSTQHTAHTVWLLNQRMERLCCHRLQYHWLVPSCRRSCSRSSRKVGNTLVMPSLQEHACLTSLSLPPSLVATAASAKMVRRGVKEVVKGLRKGEKGYERLTQQQQQRPTHSHADVNAFRAALCCGLLLLLPRPPPLLCCHDAGCAS